MDFFEEKQIYVYKDVKDIIFKYLFVFDDFFMNFMYFQFPRHDRKTCVPVLNVIFHKQNSIYKYLRYIVTIKIFNKKKYFKSNYAQIIKNIKKKDHDITKFVDIDVQIAPKKYNPNMISYYNYPNIT